MTHRVLSSDEIIQLGREYELLRRWKGVREFIHMVFGPQAQTVTLSIMSEYNDNFYDDQVAMAVLDKHGEPLEYNLELPWWSQFNLSEDDIFEIEAVAERDLRYVHYEKIGDAMVNLLAEKVGLDLIENGSAHDPISMSYDLSRPPAISFPVVYIEE